MVLLVEDSGLFGVDGDEVRERFVGFLAEVAWDFCERVLNRHPQF
jgi:hypothetical protein